MNYRINKRRKNKSKNLKTSKGIVLPSLNQKISINNKSKLSINQAHHIPNPQSDFQKDNNINNNQLKKPEKKYSKPNIFLKNHKPYSGNPSIKINNNVIDLKVPIRNNIPNSYERDILTANPSLIGNKASFKNYKENNSNLRYNENGVINEEKYKENVKEIINAKYQYSQDKGRKLFKKMGFGISKSSPRISSIKIISNPFENQKQKEMNDYSNKIRVLFSYADMNNFNKKNNNLVNIKRISKINSDSTNLKDHSNSLSKEKNYPFNLPNLMGNSSLSNSEAQNILIKAVGKLNSQLIKKHQNLKSANLNKQLSDNYIQNKIGLKITKTNSKKSLNNSLKDSKNNNSSIKLNEEKKTIQT